MSIFIGRDNELARLNALHNKKTASLVVIKGRRRIGKSRLLKEFGQQFEKSYIFSGLPPSDGTNAQSQRQAFCQQLSRELGIRGLGANDWGDLFWHLAQHTQQGQILIVLDEITWMGHLAPEFLGQLKNAWDLYFSQNPQLILALSGSISAWIESNILSSTGFVGRVSLTLTLRELPLNVCKNFWKLYGIDASCYEMLRFLAITGGIPRYLEELNPKVTAEENIRQLAFLEGSILSTEFEKIFSDLFASRNELYKKIVTLLASGPKTQTEITTLLDYSSNTETGIYLGELEKSGFIARDFTWNIRKGTPSNLSHYRLSDNYSRFYLKYILPNIIKIEKNVFEQGSITSLAGWSTTMGLQVENLVVSNHHKLKTLLKLPAEEIVMEGPFFQRKTIRNPGCQIDYLIQTYSHTLYVCEVKFSRNIIGMSVIKEMQQKIANFKTPKQFFCRPVLIHVNGVSDELIDSHYFSHIIDMAEFFT